MTVKELFKKSWQEGTQIGKNNILTAAVLGGGAHFLLYFVYKYGFGLEENIYLRLFTTFLCVSIFSYYYLSPKVQRYFFPFYWHFMLIMALPFVITFNLLKNNFHEAWLYWDIFVMFLLALYVPNWLIYMIDAIIGFGGAFLFYWATSSLSDLKPQFDVLNYLLVFSFSGFAGLCFIYGNKSAWLERQQRQYNELTSLAGSIVHEMRNPLNTINLTGSNLKDLAKLVDESNGAKMLSLVNSIFDAVKQSNEIINVVLADLQNKPINPRDYAYLRSSKFLPDLVSKYGYNSESDRSRVRVDLTDGEYSDFVFKAIPERFTFVVYNLLKNALYYLSQFPDLMVVISSEERVIGEKKYNSIYILDNGPGIPSDNMGKIFGDFYTAGKIDGTGLGLAFCRRNMRAFGGDIICDSKFGEWTKFSLLFPKLSPEEVKNAEWESGKKKILIIDDQKANLLAVKSKIEKNLPHIACDIAIDGKEGLSRARSNLYSLILTDIQMPQVSGIEVVKKIRLSDTQTPVIAITSLDYESFEKELENSKAQGLFNYFISKSIPDNILYRNVSKWIFDVEDHLPYLGNRESYIELLKDKQILLADDQEINRMVTKNKLKTSGVKITEVKDGRELVEAYKNSLNRDGKSYFDMILTDINMPPYNGDDAVLEVREVEQQNKIPHQNRIPVIALSGDSNEEAINHFFKCQMTDYFIKGYDPESLIKIIANYFAGKNEKIVETSLALDQKISEISGLAEIKVVEEKNSKENLHKLNNGKIGSFSEEDRREILNTFLKDGEQIMEKIKDLKESENIKELSFAVHSIKGISSNIGAEKLYEFIKEIEPDLKSGRFPRDKDWFENFKNYYSELKCEIKRVLV